MIFGGYARGVFCWYLPVTLFFLWLAGCSENKKSNLKSTTNSRDFAGASKDGIRLSLKKMPDSSVEIRIVNQSFEDLNVVRYLDRHGYLTVETMRSDKWSKLEAVNSDLIQEPISERNSDIVDLGPLDSVSWILNFNMFSKLSPGDFVRVVITPWKNVRKLEISKEKLFPEKKAYYDVRVE